MNMLIKTVLFVGETDCAVSEKLRDACKKAGYALTECWVERDGSAHFSEDTYDVIFSMVPGLFEEEFFELDVEKAAQLILAPCDTQLLDEMIGAAEYPEKWIGFSALGLSISDSASLEVCASLNKTPKEQTYLARDFIKSLGFATLWVPETPGLILGRILSMLVNESASALMENTATAEDIDTAMTLGTNYPMGPLRWADQIGLEKVLDILTHLEEIYRDDRYRPMLLLTQKVMRGELGVKTGQGFYTYEEAVLK